MSRRAIFALSAVAAGLIAAPATAQGWGFGVEIGRPLYGEPPPGAYADEGQPYLFEAPEGYDDAYDAEPPILAAPPSRRFLHMEAPEIVLDRLEDDGYRELSPMARRGSLYKLTAVEPSGDLVALEISIFTGEIERETVLEAARPKPRPRVAAAPRAAPRTAPRAAREIAAPRPAPATAAAPRLAAPATATAPSAAGAPTPLRDRLRIPPAKAQAKTGGDPLVVY